MYILVVGFRVVAELNCFYSLSTFEQGFCNSMHAIHNAAV